MRSSILSRAVIAAATLAIGSVTLAPAPATAATSNGITRDMVLTAAASLRADEASTSGPSDATEAALLTLGSRACDLSGATHVEAYGTPLSTPGSVDGLSVTVYIATAQSESRCGFAAIASSDPELRLSGSMNVTSSIYSFGTDVTTTDKATIELSDDVAASEGVQRDNSAVDTSFTASGSANGSIRIIKTYQVPNVTTKSDRKFARTMYDTRITNAKRAYVKARKNAKSASEKRDAKKTYIARKTHAKAKYQQAVTVYKVATERTTQNIDRPFSVQLTRAG